MPSTCPFQIQRESAFGDHPTEKRNQRSYDKLTLRTAATEAALLLIEKALTPADIAAKVSANAENFIVLGSIID